MTKHQDEQHEYLQTVGWSLLLAFVFVIVSIIELCFYTEPKKEIGLRELEIMNARIELEKLEEIEKNEPNNFKNYLKMAILHELLKEYEQAEIDYKNALIKSGNNPFVVYRMGLFYNLKREYKKVIEMAELLPNTQDKSICLLKTKLFSALAKSFGEDGDYINAVKIYRIAYKYGKNADEKTKENIAKEIARAHVRLADDAVKNNDTIGAIRALEDSNKLYPTAQGKYKLGLLYQDIDDYKAQKNIEEAYNLNPDVVNIELYSRLIISLIERSEKAQDYNKARFYTLKLNQLKRKVLANEIFKGDIKIDNFKLVTKRKSIFGKKASYATFTIKNQTKTKIQNLYIKIDIHYGKNKVISGEDKVVSRDMPLGGEKEFNNVEIKLSQALFADNTMFKYADIKIYAKKKIDTKWTMIDYMSSNFF